MEKVLAIVMAGGLGERLKPLTLERAKAAVPFGGKFRLIDFTLSNCLNSGVRQIFVLTQYRSASLQKHIQEGWGISSSGLGDYIYTVPAQQKGGADWYSGTADAVRQNLDLFRRRDIDHVLILSGDHIYKMNYLQMVAFHRMKKAGITISAVRVRKDQAAGQLGVLETDQESRLVGFEEKPAEPRIIATAPDYCYASMGVYIFNADALREALAQKGDDFGQNIVPVLCNSRDDIFIYDFEAENKIEDFIFEVRDGIRRRVLVERTRDSSYWRDVGTVDAYYEASMDLVGIDPLFNLYTEKWLLRTYQRLLPPSKCVLGGKTSESMISDGSIVSGGTVWRSILSPGVVVEKDALVTESIIFDDVNIEPGAHIRHSIVDKESRIQAGASLGYDLEADRRRSCSISPGGIVVVPKWSDIAR